jgi:hypothetical protein
MNARFWLWGEFLIAAAALLVSGASRAQDDGWRTCAEEGQTCQVRGRAVVRYGDNERWNTRTVDGAVECTNDAFGDPAPEVRKRCQVRGGYGGPAQDGGDNGDWRFCAAEGETCQFRGRAEVRFGQGRRFSTRTAYDRVRCDTSDFGDPVPGVTKYCEVRASAAVGGGNGRPDYGGGNNGANGWRYCAAEGQVCQIRGRAEVRFGEGRRYATRTVRDQVNCDVATFGDPANGILKHCEVRVQAANEPGGPGWSRCAEEGQVCQFDGRAQVRYGTSGRFVYRDGFREVACDTRSFGSDPYDGRVKHCEIRR